MNNKGFAITGIMYTLLLLFVVILVGMLIMLASRKNILDNIKNDLLNTIDAPAKTLHNTVDLTYLKKTPPSNSTACIINGFEFTHIFDKRDSKTYAVTKIGDQCWFADNLAYTTPECLASPWDSPLPHDACRLNGGPEWDSTSTLYQLEAAFNNNVSEGGKGMCPTGWHIPTDIEFKKLELNIGLSEIEVAKENSWRGIDAGKKLKANFGIFDGLDTFGFNALPVGTRSFTSLFNVNSAVSYWTSSGESGSYYIRSLFRLSPGIYRAKESSNNNGNSIRCIMDK